MAKSLARAGKRQASTTQLGLVLVKKTTFTLPRDLYKKLKIESVKRDVEMSSIVADALREFLPEEPSEP